MKHARGSFFLAVILSTAAAGFADQIPADRRDGDKGSVATQRLFHDGALQDVSALRDFDLSALKKDEFQIEFDPYVRTGDLRRDEGMEIVATQVSYGLGLSNRHVRLYDVDSGNGDPFERNEEKAHLKLHGRGRDHGHGHVSLVAVPEPPSLTLLLFGLTGLGMLFYRRKWLRKAI